MAGVSSWAPPSSRDPLLHNPSIPRNCPLVAAHQVSRVFGNGAVAPEPKKSLSMSKQLAYPQIPKPSLLQIPCDIWVGLKNKNLQKS